MCLFIRITTMPLRYVCLCVVQGSAEVCEMCSIGRDAVLCCAVRCAVAACSVPFCFSNQHHALRWYVERHTRTPCDSGMFMHVGGSVLPKPQKSRGRLSPSHAATTTRTFSWPPMCGPPQRPVANVAATEAELPDDEC